MSRKAYSFKTFSAELDGVEYSFTCWTTDSHHGFCHTCQCNSHNITNSKISYCGRTYESFEYECVLRKSIYKLGKSIGESLDEVLIKKTRKSEAERCEKMFNSFKEEYDKLPDSTKKVIAESNIHLTNEEQVQSLTNSMRMFNVMRELLQ